MHDINGKALHIGCEIHGYTYGLCKIIGMQEEHNPDEGGAAIVVLPQGQTESIMIRTHTARVSRVRTWKELANLALQVQDAVNLSGVLSSFVCVIAEVRARLEADSKGGTNEYLEG